MNKSFQFRVWDKANKRFNYVDLVEYLRIAQTHDESAKFTNSNASFHDSVIAQMFTGREGKKGKRIYQGDIIKIHNNGNHTKREYWYPIFEVTWNGFEFGLKYLGGGNEGDGNMFTFRHYPNHIEVLGNVFESTIVIPKRD